MTIVANFLLLLCVICITPPFVVAQHTALPGPGWREARIVGVRTDNSKVPIAFFVNTTLKPPYAPSPAPGEWHYIAVKPLGIPEDAHSVFLTGILTITHGLLFEICNLTVALRAPGDSLTAGNYIMQTVAALQGDGERSNASSMVPVKDGKFELQWNRPQPIIGEWPEHCSYNINLSAQAYFRDASEAPVEEKVWEFELKGLWSLSGSVKRRGSPP